MSMNQFGTDQAEREEEDVVIEFEDVSVQFPSGRGRIRPLNDVSFEVQRGELLGVIGESGSGKSMFASALLNSVVEPGVLTGNIYFSPEDGERVELTDLDGSEMRSLRWDSIASVPQGAMSSFNPTRTIKKHFQETLSAHDYDETGGMQRARELLEDLNVDPDMAFSSFAHELSGGQKQRILIALSLLLDPEVLVLDEPTAALDLVMQRRIINHLYEIKDKYDITVVFISHDLAMVTGFAERVAIMYAFEVVETGTASQILNSPSHPYTRALLKSTPSLNIDVENIEAITGQSPDPVNIPEGCSYHPRCPLADDRCEMEDPALADIDDGQEVACFYWDQAADAVPLDIGGENR
jgi:oligopeptide/dipeptide ABC transporter ATP-binding protein